ncbi:MAG: hypothetical protein U1F77_15465 [Kiritimatiellia bacterium]
MKPFWKTTVIALLAGVGILGSVAAYRVYRGATVGMAMVSNLRYQLENGETLDTMPAEQAFSANYLELIFGENPALMKELQRVLQQGLQDSSRLQLDEVSAMLVTYRQGDDPGQVQDLCAHIFGSYKVARRRPGFHRDGYFRHLVDRGLWDLGNTVIGFLGRDLLFFADPAAEEMQRKLIDSMFTGDIQPVVAAVEKPYHYIMAIPNPRKLLPPQLRRQIQTMIIRGDMSLYKGSTEMIFLCSSGRAADYTSAVFGDLKIGAEATLKTKFGGYVSERPWGPQVETWWAYEMAMTLGRSKFKPDDNLVRMNMKYGRVMNNALLKSIERMGRDLFQITGTMELKKDPRAVDAELKSNKGSHYWSSEHKWGPNWPIAPPKVKAWTPPTTGSSPRRIPRLRPHHNPAAPAGTPPRQSLTGPRDSRRP